MSNLQVGDVVTRDGWADSDREVIVGTYMGYWVCVDVVAIDEAVRDPYNGQLRLDLPESDCVRLRSSSDTKLVKWERTWREGDRVYHPSEGSTFWVLSTSGDYLWLQSDNDSPRTIHKNSPFGNDLVKAPF